MNPVKHRQMREEFTFLDQILEEQSLKHVNSLQNIEVARGDQNLLEVTPFAVAHDMGEYGDYNKSRIFYTVNADGIAVQLGSAWCRSQVPHGTKGAHSAEPIGAQILPMTQDIEFLVEVNQENDGCTCEKYIIIYRMKGFDWRKACRHMQVSKV
mgnify:FL=1